MFGGTMRQTGLLAGAAIYALDHHLHRLADDHDNAKRLALGLQDIEGVACSVENTETNLVFFDLDSCHGDGASFCRKLWENGVLAESLDAQGIRFVTHLGNTPQEIDHAIQTTANLCQHGN